MLKWRIITAVVLIPLVLVGIFYANPLVLAFVLSGISILAAYEWLKLTHSPVWMQVLFYFLLLMCCYGFYNNPAFMKMAIYFSVPGWLLAFVAIIFYQRGHAIVPQPVWVNTLVGLWLIAPMWAGLYMILTFNPLLLLFLLILVWSADICAFFAGRQWGRHLLASRVSPGKSWEGAIGAFLGTTLIAFLFIHIFFPQAKGFALLLLAMCIIPVSIVGDLFESMVKRIYNVKDSGQLLPGHGGVLDRLDSLTAAAPIFAWGYFFFLALEI